MASQEDRAERIEAAAYAVLRDKGFKGTSMLAVAKAAKASNETLYRWYGDKIGLFAAMIERNADRVEEALVAAQHAGATGLAALDAVGRVLLAMVTSENAIALNRAAADMSGKLGGLLASGGRDRVAPILTDLIQQAYPNASDATERAETYIALLIGDLQIRRAILAQDVLTEGAIDRRASRALSQFKTLYP